MTISAKLFAKFASDPSAFRNDLNIDVDGSVRRFGDCMDPWQREDFAALNPALMRCNGRSDTDAKMRAYLERGRGHSKTTDLAVMSVWALAFAARPIRGFCFAADRDQAGLLRDAMATVARLNPWLSVILDVQKNLVVNIAEGHPGQGGKLEIFTSDVGSSYGILPDLIIADELVHWEGDGSLWHSLISSAAKRSNCLLCVISNAGFLDSWQWQVREAARVDESWIFSRLDGPVASWMTEARLDEQRRMLPPVAFDRLWGNRWSTGGGDALTAADVEAAFDFNLRPLNDAGWDRTREFVAGLDLGVSRDASAVVVIGVKRGYEGHGQIRLAHCTLWSPSKGKKIDLQEIEDKLVELNHRFKLKSINYDPWQATHMAQRLQAGNLAAC